jgi:hypothetical protein
MIITDTITMTTPVMGMTPVTGMTIRIRMT